MLRLFLCFLFVCVMFFGSWQFGQGQVIWSCVDAAFAIALLFLITRKK